MRRFPYTVNWMRLGFSIVFYTLENNYFGWNKQPQSPEEVIADGIFVLILALSFSLPTDAGG